MYNTLCELYGENCCQDSYMLDGKILDVLLILDNCKIDVEYDGETFTYVAETNSNGVATFHIPTTDLNWSPEIYVRVNKFVDDKFSYYKMEYDEDEGENKAVKYTLSGYFEQVSGNTDRPEFNDIEGMPTPEHRVKMNFFTFDADEDHGHSNENWYNIEF